MTYLSGSGAIVGRIRLPTRPSREARVTYHGRAIDSRNMRPTMDDKCATQFFGPITENEIELIPDSSLYGPNSRPLYLIVVNGGIPGSMIRLKRDGTSIGRSATNDFRLHDPSISRHHAAIGADTSGELWLSDLASTNGTFLNGKRLDPHLAVRIRDGDRIQFGKAVVVKFVSLDPSDEKFQREMFERTVRDPLTGLFNRSYFLDQLGAIADTGSSRGLGLAVLLLDLDHFKRVNDTFGHDAGDAVLREVATVLRESTRPEDLVARYGGEEFIVALPVSAPDQAFERAERIRTNLAGRPILAGDIRLNVTASFGLAYADPGRARIPTKLITLADSCLYQAKHLGRNRVMGQSGVDLDSEPVTPGSSDS